MFGKLKEKLKKSLSIFSKKTEEESTETFSKEHVEELEQQSADSQTQESQITVAVEEKTVENKDIVTEKPVTTETKSAPVTTKEAPTVVKQKHDKPKVKQQKVTTTKEPTVEHTKSATSTVTEEKSEESVVAAPKAELQEEPKKQSLFSKLTQKLTTKSITDDKFEELFWDLEIALLESNVGVKVIQRIKTDLKEELVNKALPRNVLAAIEETLKKTLTEILSFEVPSLLEQLESKQDKPFVVAVFGINGAGKTTSIAKLTHYLQSHGKTVALAAGDTFRAAAIQQLEDHATRLGVKMIKHDYGSDAAAVAFDAIQYAKKNAIDVVLIDTAGRLHSNTNLMQELQKIIKVSKPDLKLFVGESITGNDCIEQAEKFNEMLGIDGAILTKADIDENGGAPLSISYTIGKPIYFLGMGQEYKDFIPFDASLILERLGF